jgi:hypothetical protein
MPTLAAFGNKIALRRIGDEIPQPLAAAIVG